MKQFDYNDYNLVELSTLNPRSFILPYKDLANAKSDNPEIISLNGEWNFAYFTSILDVNDDVKNIYYNRKIDIPSCWQYHGIEEPFYVNNDYQFPFNPPYLPISTPVGVYNKIFTINNKENNIFILSFLGSNATTVYINGKIIGYFEGTHNMHEFDITDFVKQGDNEITLIVYKWCVGSYLESQDMYRDNGIFRDVLISINPKTYIFDYKIDTHRIKGKTYSLSISTIIANDNESITQSILLYDDKKNLIIEKEFKNHFITELDVNEWSAETPNLYSLNIILKNKDSVIECIKSNVGFKTIDIKDGIFMVNNTPIKIKGINYHESTPENGFYVPKETFFKDIQIIKSLNCNTIRFSHYPPHPYMLELCEKYGLYVIDEADIETYGCLATSNKDFVTNNKIFESRFINRVKHLYERDKNSCAIIMWSIANESGIGNNLDKAYEYLHSVSNIPVQYETCFRTEYDEFFKDKKQRGYDIISIMYPSLETLKYYNLLEDIRPFYMCEYMHSMGLGPGEMKDIWDYIYSTPRLIGGCVWEYCDHANLLKDDINDKKVKYLYGGDNGEYIHDSNFCCDGVVLPNRALSTSAKEMKNIYRPFIFTNNGNEIFIKNTNSFTNSNNYSFIVETYKNGVLINETIRKILVEPFEKKQFLIVNYDNFAEYSFVIKTQKNNEIVGVDNFVFGSYNQTVDTKFANVDGRIIKGDNYVASFDERYRTMTSLVVNGKEIICQKPLNCGYSDFDKNVKGFIPNIFHAPTDNDRYIKDEWISKLYNKMWISFYQTENDKNTFIQKGIFSPAKYEAMFEIITRYEFYEKIIKIHFEVESKYDLLPIPKFGLRLQINKEFNKVTYYGYGPNENYPDFRSSNYLAIFQCDADDFNEYYIKPQENGNRMDNRFLKIQSSDGTGFEILSPHNDFSFSIHNYSLEDLCVAKHDYELPNRDFYEITIDGYIRGVGSQSCGPKLDNKYELQLKKGEKLAFDIYIKPLDK